MRKIKGIARYSVCGIFTIIIFICQPLFLSAEDIIPMILEGGGKSGYSSGLLESHWYHQVYFKGGYKWNKADLSAGYSHYFQYQVSDINGDVQSVDISRISSEAELYPTEKITFSGMIAGWFGQQDYRCIEGIGSCSYEGKNWSYTLEAGVSRATYMFNFVEQKIFSWDVYFEGARYLSDTFSIDGSYSLIFAGMDGMEDIYKHLFRGGFSLVPVENVFLFSGVTLSIDTTEFINFGFDIGGSTYIFRYVKLSFSYMLSYGNSFTADSNVSLPGPSPGTTSETERYFSHRIFFGAALKYR